MIKKIWPYLFIAIITTVIFCVVRGFWNWNIDIPIKISGDSITDGGTVTLAKKAVRGEGILSASCFWTIDGENTVWGIMDGSVHYVIMCILALFTDSVGVVVNVYFILTFVLCGWFMYYAISGMNVDKGVAITIAAIYAFLPGHLIRDIEHLAIGSCFALPLMVLGCLYLVHDSSKIKIIEIDKLKISLKIDFILVEAIIGALLVGFSSIYFCTFAMILHAICALLTVINKKWKKMIYSFVLIGIDLICLFFTVVMPNLLSKGAAVAQFANSSSRQISDINLYGMKITQLIMPISGHRIPLLANIRNYYSMSFPENENSSSSLGLLLSIAFIISIVFILIEKDDFKNFYIIKQIGKINCIILIISLVGGGAELIGLIVSSIRCYNRMSFIIACFSAIVAALLLDVIIKNRKSVIKILVCASLIFIGVFDQTTKSMYITPEIAHQAQNEWNVESVFFQKLEKKGITNVLVYPSKYSNEFSPILNNKYETMKTFIHTDGIKFTVGYLEGSKTDEWIKALESYTTEEKIKICAIEGFDGILLYKDGFSNQEIFFSIYDELVDLLGDENVIISSDGEWYYFSIEEYLFKLDNWDKKILKKMSEEIIIEEVKFDYIYEFKNSEIDKHLESGFYAAEPELRWSMGDESTIRFRVNKEKFGDLKIDMNYVYSISPQTIEVVIDNNVIADYTINDTRGEISFTIPRDLIMNGDIRLTLRYSNATSPVSVGINGDNRKLAVAWSTLEISDTNNNTQEIENYKEILYFEKYLER